MDDDISQMSFVSLCVTCWSLKCDTLYSIAENSLHQRKKKKGIIYLLVIERVIHTRSESHSISHMNLFVCPKFGLLTKLFKVLIPQSSFITVLNAFLSDVTNICDVFCSHPLPKEQALEA